MKKQLIKILAAVVLLAGSAGAKPIPVILDTDIGGDIDDTWALGLLLKSPELDVRLVVGDYGCARYRAKLLAKFLQTVGRTDIPVGVGLDTLKVDAGPQFEWVKDYDLDTYPGKVYQDGIQALIDTIMQSREPVTLICIGPLPNVAAALKREPRIAIHARFVGMFGSIHVGYDGSQKVTAEGNVRLDAKACQVVFAAPWDMTITPLDTCGLFGLAGDRYAKIRDSQDPICAALITNYRIWAKAVNEAQMVDTRIDAEERTTVLFDTVAVYLAIRQDYCQMESLRIRITDDGFTRIDSGGRPVNVATAWKDLDAYSNFVVERLTGKSDFKR